MYCKHDCSASRNSTMSSPNAVISNDSQINERLWKKIGARCILDAISGGMPLRDTIPRPFVLRVSIYDYKRHVLLKFEWISGHERSHESKEEVSGYIFSQFEV